MLNCSKCTDALCVIRNRKLPRSMMVMCDAGSGATVDSLLSKIDDGRKARKVPTRSVRQQRGGTASKPRVSKPCTTCGSKRQASLHSRQQSTLLTTIAARAASLAAAAVDFVRDGMAIATDEQQAHRLAVCKSCPVFKDGWCDDAKGGCGCNLSLKVMARAAHCPQYKWFAYTDNYRPLINPTRSLIYHLYPKRGAEWNWHWHLEQIKKYQHLFNGKIVIGVGVDRETATFEQVQKLAEGINVTKWIRADNTKALAETHTHVPMMAEVETADPNAIVFRYHTKGVTKVRGSMEQRWAHLLWEANMDIAAVEDALASHSTCGAMRALKPLVSTRPGDFFFAGSAYWFRAADAFSRDWRHTDNSRWWVEYVPVHLFDRPESACLLYDLTENAVFGDNHFTTFIQPEWDQWKAARGIE